MDSGFEPDIIDISKTHYYNPKSKWVKFKMPELSPKEQIEKMFNEILNPQGFIFWQEWANKIREGEDYPL